MMQLIKQFFYVSVIPVLLMGCTGSMLSSFGSSDSHQSDSPRMTVQRNDAPVVSKVEVPASQSLSGAKSADSANQAIRSETHSASASVDSLSPKPTVVPARNNGISPAAPLAPSSKPTRTVKYNRDSRKMAIRNQADFSYQDQILSEDVSWHGQVSIEGYLTLAPQATLTIEPGTVIRFRRGADSSAGSFSGALLVQGRIVANGATDKPIKFTSEFMEPQGGDWQGIVLLASEKKNFFENCLIEGAETGIDASFSTVTIKNVLLTSCETGFHFQDSLVVILGGGANNCLLAMDVYGSELDMREMNLSGNQKGMLAFSSSLHLLGNVLYGNELQAFAAEGSKLKIQGNSFTVNGSGLYLSGCEGAVTGNRILKNNDYGLYLNNARVRISGNDVSQNGKTGLRVDDGKGIAWGNAIYANGLYDIYNAGQEDFKAIGNWWGIQPVDVYKRIYDGTRESGLGRVLYLPVLKAKPQNTP